MSLLLSWIINGLAIFITAYLLPGVGVRDLTTALIVSVVLGVINMLLKPILIFLTLPINIISLGLFTFVINALLIMLASRVVSGFTVESFWWALLFSLLLSIVNGILSGVAR